jgi:hypothetical protein
MRDLADVAGMPNVRSCWAFIHGEIVCQGRPLEMKLESTPDFYHSEMRAACRQFSGMSFVRIFSLAFLNSSSVAAFRGSNSDGGNGACIATSRQARKIMVPEALYSHETFLSIRSNASSEGERCMKDIVHPIVHFSVHLRICRRVYSRRSCAWHNDQFGRGQNTGLGWSDPTFVHVSVPKVIRGVAPAQLRGDRAECFVRSAFCSRRPQQ